MTHPQSWGPRISVGRDDAPHSCPQPDSHQPMTPPVLQAVLPWWPTQIRWFRSGAYTFRKDVVGLPTKYSPADGGSPKPSSDAANPHDACAEPTRRLAL